MIVDQIEYADRKAMWSTALTTAISTPIERAQTLPENTATPAAMITMPATMCTHPQTVKSTLTTEPISRRGRTRP